MDNEKRYRPADLAAVTGVPAATLRAWRSRNGLFPETQESDGWNYYSLADICIVYLVRLLTGMGLGANAACQIAMSCKKGLESIVKAHAGDEDDSELPPYIGLTSAEYMESGSSPKQEAEIKLVHADRTFMETFVTRFDGVAIIISVLEIFYTVTEKLRELEIKPQMSRAEYDEYAQKMLDDTIDRLTEKLVKAIQDREKLK